MRNQNVIRTQMFGPSFRGHHSWHLEFELANSKTLKAGGRRGRVVIWIPYLTLSIPGFFEFGSGSPHQINRELLVCLIWTFAFYVKPKKSIVPILKKKNNSFPNQIRFLHAVFCFWKIIKGRNVRNEKDFPKQNKTINL